MGNKYIDNVKLTTVCKKILEEVEISSEHAEIISRTLVKADLRGVHSHGVIRLPFYVQRLIDGGTKSNPDFKLTKETTTTAIFDADDGMGQVATYFAMEKCIEKAKESGISYIPIKKSGHFGAASLYAEQALEHNMIGVAMSNVTNVMAPYGGCERKIGNNPLAAAIPTKSYDPILLDMSMSKVAGGKVREAAKKGEEIPDDWIISKEGSKTTNPNKLEEGGALLPLGHKGVGLAVVIEALTGGLAGSKLMSQIPLWFRETEEPTNVGHSVLAINIENFVDIDIFKERMDYVVKHLKSSKLAEGYEGIYAPGELEFSTERESLQNGIPLNKSIINDLNKLTEKFSLDISI